MARKGRGYITRKYVNKNGDVVYYHYTKSSTGRLTKAGKTTKASYQAVSVITPGAKTLSRQAIDEYFDDHAIDFNVRRIILNELEPAEESGLAPKHFTQPQLEAHIESLVNDVKSDRLTAMLRNAGYSMKEFENEFGITEAELRAGKFEKTGTSVKFTDRLGQVIMFNWDYNRGYIKV